MDKVKLKDISNVYSGSTYRRYLEKGCGNFKKIIVQKSIQKGEPIKDLLEEEISNNINERYLSRDGDILMKTPFPNDVVFVDEEGLIIGDRIAIIRLKEGYDSSFITHYLNNVHIKKQLNRVTTSETIPQVSIEEIKELELILPDYQTQKDYGTLLNLIDKKININYSIIESEKRLKEGILNNLIGDGE